MKRLLRARPIRFAVVIALAFGVGGVPQQARTAPIPVIDPCDEATGPVDPRTGKTILPGPPYDEGPTEFNVDQVQPDLVDVLYPGYDTTTDTWYENVPCDWSIEADGDPIPDEAKDFDVNAMLSQFGLTAEEFAEMIEEMSDEALEHARGRIFPAELDPVDCPVHPITPVSDIAEYRRWLLSQVNSMGTSLPGGTAVPPWQVGPAGAIVNSAASPFAQLLSERCYSGPRNVRPLKPEKPFSGRDIIFVHGFMSEPIAKNFAFQSGLGWYGGYATRWPADSSEFLTNGGYWKQQANDYWDDHILRNLKGGNPATPASNRYMVVSWAPTQWMVFGLHATLRQMSRAIRFGDGVVNEADPADRSDFCSNKCVIVSHSTGGLVTDSAMSIAAETESDWAAKQIWGNISFIPERIEAQVALQDAFSGSHLATLSVGAAIAAISAGQSLGPICNLLLNVAATLFGASNPCAGLFGVLQSVLVDLVPAVSQVLWGPQVASTPVPVIMTASAHPTADPLATKATQLGKLLLHPGYDDGVLTGNSQCADPTPMYSWPAGYIAEPTVTDALLNAGITAGLAPLTTPFIMAYSPVMFKVWDRGIEERRAVGYYKAQSLDRLLSLDSIIRNLPYFAAAICTPYVSPTGMVNPVASNTPNSLSRYPNHYSFIVTTSDHFSGPLNEGVPNSQCYEQTPLGSSNQCQNNASDNREEIRVITDSKIYDWVSPRIKNQIEEREVGKKVKFKKFGIGFEWWLWKRVYHRLVGWETMTETDYVYEYVLRP